MFSAAFYAFYALDSFLSHYTAYNNCLTKYIFYSSKIFKSIDFNTEFDIII